MSRSRPGGTAAIVQEAVKVIEIDSVTKSFGDVRALDGLSLTAYQGEILGVLGRNGAGKTTTINLLSTLLRPDSGSARVCGFDVVADGAKVREVIAMTGQYASLDEELTGHQNLVLLARMLGAAKTQAVARADELLDQFGLSDAGDRQVKNYSGGMRRRLDLAATLIGQLKVLFLDEPTTGLDAHSRAVVWDQVAALRDAGVTVVLTTQYLEEADHLADRIILIERGTVIAEGTADALKDQVGQPYCIVVTDRLDDIERAAALLTDLDAEILDDAIRVPARGGVDTLTDIAARMSAAGISLSDIGLRRPTLDEVFLTLTGPSHEASS